MLAVVVTVDSYNDETVITDCIRLDNFYSISMIVSSCEMAIFSDRDVKLSGQTCLFLSPSLYSYVHN